MSSGRVIVIGGGLSGLAAAHTVIQKGGSVTLVERNMFMGGNSTKATSGINGGGTRTQKAMGVKDSKAQFIEDTVRGASGHYTGPWEHAKYGLGTVLAGNSADAVHWLQDEFGLALDTVSRLGGHSFPRTHRSKNGTTFPGMEITFCLMKRYEELCASHPDRVKLYTKARVHKLTHDQNGRVSGVVFKGADGEDVFVEGHAVVIASGGYGAGGLAKGSLLEQIRPDLCNLPTTNGSHCTGDGVQIAEAAGASPIDLKHVQVHPTGLVHLDDPDNRTKFLAAEALRGEGGILLDRDGNRFCNDLGTRDYVTMCMWKHGKPPYRLVLNKAAYSNIAWHCKHYCGRRVMKNCDGATLASDLGISAGALQTSFDSYNNICNTKKDPWGKKYFPTKDFTIKDDFMVAIVTPVVHYVMGGLEISPDAECVSVSDGMSKPGLFAAGEVTGGVHGRNRLGGSALLECAVFGRVAGDSAFAYIQAGRPGAHKVERVNGMPDSQVSTIPPPHLAGHGVPDDERKIGEAVVAVKSDYSMEEVAKHKTDNDCWVVVNGKVLNVTDFLDDHPGGKMAIMTFAGRDATEEFGMVHEEGTLEKYASEYILGNVKPKSRL